MLSDEDLAKIAWDARGWPIPWEKVSPPTRANLIAGARAIRAALLPDVAPLGRGEVVTVPFVDSADAGIHLRRHPILARPIMRVRLCLDLRTRAIHDLDAAGVARLELACRRWRLAQESPNDDTMATGHDRAEGGADG